MNEALSGDHAECVDAARTALRMIAGSEHHWIAASADLAVGLSHAMQGEHARAVQEMTSAYDGAVRAGDSFLESYAVTNLALQQFLVSDTAAGRDLFTTALRLSVRLHNLRATAGCFEGLGYLAASEGNARVGARLMAAAARIRDITGAPLLPQWVRPHERHQQLVDAALGSRVAAIEGATGAATPVDDLTAMLLG